MITEFTNEQLTPLNDLKELLTEYASSPDFNLVALSFNELWEQLRENEQNLMDTDSTGDIEFGIWLYVLNNNNIKGLSDILKHYGMPTSSLDFEALQKRIDLGGFIAGDGSLVSFSKYAVLDTGWLVSLYYYIKYKYIFPKKKHAFVVNTKNPKTVTSNDITFAVLGDWGTGKWRDGDQQINCPSELVMRGIQNLTDTNGLPIVDTIIHLGDVYYAGTKKEETDNFINHLPKKYANKFFTLNSNHEMYDGANGYFDRALGNPYFGAQNGVGYFAIEGNSWVIVCLDSGFYDESGLYMKGAITNDADLKKHQVKFLAQYANTNKQLILMTHHNGINYNGTERNDKQNKGVLWNQVTDALKGKTPDTWYWGHIHNAFVYNDNNSIVANSTSINGGKPKFRCCGHAAIPYGVATNFDINTMDYYAKTLMDVKKPDETQKIRILNGFATIRLTDSFMTETFYTVSNSNNKPKEVWSLTTSF